MVLVATALIVLTALWVRCNTNPSAPPNKNAGDPVVVDGEFTKIFDRWGEFLWAAQRLFHIAIASALLLQLTLNQPQSTTKRLAESYSFWIAAMLALIGGFLRLWAFQALGNRFTFRLGIKKGAQLKTDGIYRLIRHPSYTGAHGINFGFAAVLTQVINLLRWPQPIIWLLWCFPCTIALFLVRRIRVEEEMLSTHFGQQYKSYQQKTWRLIPFIY